MIDRRRLRRLRQLSRHVRSKDPGRLHLAIARLQEIDDHEGGLLPAERNLLAQAQRKLGGGGR